jgi:glycosyltransferase involved in cell wall biosynthesis
MRLDQYEFRARVAPRPRLVWLRSFHDIYNPCLGPQVVARLAKEFPDVHLVMAGPDRGDGSLERTKATAAALGVQERVEFPGAIAKSAISTWMNQGDIFLNTTNVDNTPVSVIEAMACGLCVASTDVGGLPYLLDHGRTALLVPANSAEALAAAVRLLLTDAGLARALSTQGRERAEEMSWTRIIPTWNRLLLGAMKRESYGSPRPAMSKMDA